MDKVLNFKQGRVPLLISMPHAGLRLTPAVEAGLIPDAKSLPDTDWHIPQLYEFAAELGASTLAAEYSRFVIDLNRPSDDKPLYVGATTGLYPATLFDGIPLFREGLEPSAEERATYLEQIWTPYHSTLQNELARLKAEFGYALLFDAHSIRSIIPHLFDGKLPDFNLGTFNGASCDPAVGHPAGSDLRAPRRLQPCAERSLQGRPHHPALRQSGREHSCRATGTGPVHLYGRVRAVPLSPGPGSADASGAQGIAARVVGLGRKALRIMRFGATPVSWLASEEAITSGINVD